MKYLQIKSTNEEILQNCENGGAVTSLLLSLLDEGKVDGILNLKKQDNVYDGIPTFVTTKEELLKTSGSLHCAPTMTSDIIENAEKMIKLFYDVDPEDVIKEEINKGQFIIELKNGEEKSVKIDDLEDEGYGRRDNCQRCELKIPRKADVACGNWGSSKGYTFVEINTPKGEELIKNAIDKGYIEVKDPSEKQITIRGKVETVMKKMARKAQKMKY